MIELVLDVVDTNEKPWTKEDVVSTVFIKDVSTGEIRSFEDDHSVYFADGEYNFFMWDEGNWSCDCNRELFFNRAGGQQYDNKDLVCGDGIRYSVNIEIDGKIEYREYE